MKKIIISLATLFCTVVLTAQNFSNIPTAIVETLHSDIVGQDYKLYISLPHDYNPQKRTYPVFYYLDAWNSSGGMNEMVKTKMFMNEIDRVIMVGISYDANPMTHPQIRMRDYCPPINEKDTLKGGEKFYRFIAQELIPHMEESYAADPNDRGLLGHSISALFTAWTLKQEPVLFNRLAISSPSLWYGGDEFLLENEQFLRTLENTQGLRIFICYGSLEPKKGHVLKGDKLFDLISKNEKNHVHKVIFEDETHGTVWYPGTAKALNYLYQSDYKLYMSEGMRYFDNNNFDKALQRFELAFSANPKEADDGDRYNFACLYSLTGNADKAFQYLETMKQSKRNWHAHMLKDADLVPLHDDSRWNTLLAELKK
jgi:predicted alpha/beta superfamily hydrolase